MDSWGTVIVAVYILLAHCGTCVQCQRLPSRQNEGISYTGEGTAACSARP